MSSASLAPYWLEDDFDPNSFKIVELRKHLSDYDVALPPSTVKKAFLVDLWNKLVYPRRREIKRALKSLTPSKHDQIRNLTPERIESISTAGKGFVSTSDNSSSSSDDNNNAPPVRRVHSKMRQTTARHQETDESEDDASFSDDNVFQKLQSPLYDDRVDRREKSRKKQRDYTSTISYTTSDSEDVSTNTPHYSVNELRPSRKLKRTLQNTNTVKHSTISSDEESEDKLVRSSSRDYNSSSQPYVSKNNSYPLRKRSQVEGTNVGARTRSTSRIDVANSISSVKSDRRDNSSKSTKNEDEMTKINTQSAHGLKSRHFFTLPATPMFTPPYQAPSKHPLTEPKPDKVDKAVGLLPRLLVLFTLGCSLYYGYVVAKKGFCDSRSVISGAIELRKSPLERFLHPTCRSCPDHAICHGKMVIGCTDGRVLTRSPFSSQLFEFSPACKPDTEKTHRVDQLLHSLAQVLALNTGRLECQGRTNISVSEENILAILKKLTPSTWPSQRVNEYYQAVIYELRNQPKPSSLGINCIRPTPPTANNKDNTGNYKYTSAKPIYPLRCRIHRNISLFANEYKFRLAGAAATLMGLVHLYHRYRRRTYLRAQIDALTEDVIDLLLDQEALHERNVKELPALSIAGLKSSFFPSTSKVPHADATDIWYGVCKNVRGNANIRESIQSFKGEPQEMWEWIGGGVLSPKLRKISRRSGSTSGLAYSSEEESIPPTSAIRFTAPINSQGFARYPQL